MAPDKVASDVTAVTLRFEVKSAHGKHWPMLVAIGEDGAEVEATLHINGFKHREDAEKILQTAHKALEVHLAEDEGSET